MWKQMLTGLFQFALTIVLIAGVVWWVFFDDGDMSAVDDRLDGTGQVASRSADFSEPPSQAPSLPSANADPGAGTAAVASGSLSTVQAELKVLEPDAATPRWVTSTGDTGPAPHAAPAAPVPAQAAPKPTPAAPVATQAPPEPTPTVEPVATPEPKPTPAASAETKADTEPASDAPEPATRACARPERGDPQAWATYRRCRFQQRAARQCALRQASMLARLTTDMNRCRMMGPRATSCQAHVQAMRRQVTASCQGVPGS